MLEDHLAAAERVVLPHRRRARRNRRRQPAADVEVKGRELPPPTEGEPIPPGRPSGSRVRTTASGTSGPPRPTITSRSAGRGCKPRVRADSATTSTASFAALPSRTGNAQLALRLNQASRWYPRLIVWIVVGLVALAVRRPRGTRTLLGVSLAALVVVVLNALGLFADPRFALPVAPAFVLFGSCALLGRRSRVPQ